MPAIYVASYVYTMIMIMKYQFSVNFKIGSSASYN